MEQNNLLMTVAVLAVVISFIGVSVTYNSVSSFRNYLTGFATENGTVNLSVSSLASVEIRTVNTVSTDTLQWGSGSVNVSDPAFSAQGYAILYTNTTSDNCSNGWNDIDEGFIIENTGNVNVSLDISSSLVAADFVGGTSPSFMYYVDDSGEDSNSCIDDATLTEFTTTPAQLCSTFQFEDSRDSLELGLYLKIPTDADTGEATNIIVLTYEDNSA